MQRSKSDKEIKQANATPRASLAEVAALFLRLGFTAFGGPAAHIAMMEHEVVVRRKWLTHERFLDLLGAANLIPGPSSTEMALYGYTQAGWLGILLGGVCFILPAALMTLALAWAYVRFGRLPQIGGLLYGVKPVVIAIIAQAIWKLGRTAVKSWLYALVGLSALLVAAATGSTISLLLGTGIVMCIVLGLKEPRVRKAAAGIVLPFKGLLALPAVAIASVSLASLFLVFLKIGALVFGSGYVLLAFLKAELVDQRHWLTSGQLLDAVAVGQVTPGPVFTTATFIGYVLGGFSGAALATTAIFLPGFLLVAASGPLVARLRRSAIAGHFLDGVNLAALALMTVVTWQLGRISIRDVPTIALVIVSRCCCFASA
jgi:chromate transporter